MFHLPLQPGLHDLCISLRGPFQLQSDSLRLLEAYHKRSVDIRHQVRQGLVFARRKHYKEAYQQTEPERRGIRVCLPTVEHARTGTT